MQLIHLLLGALLAVSAVEASTLNEPCAGASGEPGVCISTAACRSAGGKTINGACPGISAKCCLKDSCKGGTGCGWSSDCSGETVSGQCPGPSQFKCCKGTPTAFGAYDFNPKVPKGGCKQVAIDGANAVIANFAGRVREIGCFRDSPCRDGSEHGCGTAIDFMCSDGYGRPTMSGQEIAEWLMDRHTTYKVKYIIWGQRIWNPSKKHKPDRVKRWPSWRTMENRHSITQNHWDHVHVTFKG